MVDDVELEELLNWVVENHMTDPREGHTTVSTAHVDHAAGVVVVALTRKDEGYAASLTEASGGRIIVEPDPTQVIALPPAQVRAPVTEKQSGSRTMKPQHNKKTER